MPYIRQNERDLLDPHIKELAILFNGKNLGPGALNYVISCLISRTTSREYADLNAVLGVLEAVKLELYRRVVALYEDRKIEENGDIVDYRVHYT